jgi:hypothetical protein
MLYRIYFTDDAGEDFLEIEADSPTIARRKAMGRLDPSARLGTIQDVTPKVEEEDEHVEVVEIPNEDSGAGSSPKGGGGDPSGGGGGKPPKADATDWEALFSQQDKEHKRVMDEAEKFHQKRLEEQQNSFNKRMENTVKTYTDQITNLEGKWSNAIDMGKGAGFDASKGKGKGPSDYSMYGFEGFDPNARAVDSMSPDDRRMLLEMQSPLASFRQGMTAGLGGVPQNYLAKNYLERFMNPAQTAYSVLGGMGGSEGQDFQGFVQNLFSGGSPRAQLGTMLGTGLEQLAGTGRADLAGMDPSQRAYFEGLTRPDITQEGGRANIEDVLGLAYGTQAQRFSPLILQQMRRGLSSQDELWADFQTQAMTGGGDPNFARFVQQQFGL